MIGVGVVVLQRSLCFGFRIRPVSCNAFASAFLFHELAIGRGISETNHEKQHRPILLRVEYKRFPSVSFLPKTNDFVCPFSGNAYTLIQSDRPKRFYFLFYLLFFNGKRRFNNTRCDSSYPYIAPRHTIVLCSPRATPPTKSRKLHITPIFGDKVTQNT